MNREKMVRLQDVQKDYKSSQNNPKTQYNRYASNKGQKSGIRRAKNEVKYKENENTINETVKKKIDNHKGGRAKKGKSRRHKKHKNNTSF